MSACSSYDGCSGRHAKATPYLQVGLNLAHGRLGERLVAGLCCGDMKATPGSYLPRDVVSGPPHCRVCHGHLRAGARGKDHEMALGKDP
ncbi:MAG: hypothetical protein ACREQ5_25725 [Candidatus Dormibacteria bacterium]